MQSLHPQSSSQPHSIYEGLDQTCLPAPTLPDIDVDHVEEYGSEWMAIEPPNFPKPNAKQSPPFPGPQSSSEPPPSFRDSQFGIILRRQRHRPADNSGLKTSEAHLSRFINLSNSFEFAGWGSITRLKLANEHHVYGSSHVEAFHEAQVLGQFTASALAGNAVLGSVFYALPAVVVVAGI